MIIELRREAFKSQEHLAQPTHFYVYAKVDIGPAGRLIAAEIDVLIGVIKYLEEVDHPRQPRWVNDNNSRQSAFRTWRGAAKSLITIRGKE